MRKFLLILSLLLSLSVTAQNIVTTPLGGFYARNGVGNDRWNEQSVGSGQSVTGYPDPTVYYRRFTVPEVTNPDGTYTWARFDSKINAAIQDRQKFAFRFFTMYAWPESDDFFNKTPTMSGINQNGNVVSARSAVPLEWHTAMQAGSPRNWISESGDWVPNYNSPAYLTRLNNLHAAVANHLDTGGYTPTWSATRIDYKDVIQYIDVSGFGTWGEWHSYGTAPGNNVQNYPGYNLNDTTQDQRAGSTFPTIATFKAIIDAHKNNYPNYQLCIIINAFDAMRLGNTKIPAEVGVYAYQTRNAKGWMGRRIDHAGEQTGYDDFYLQLNPGSFGGYRMDTASTYRHNLAPFVGEPPGGPVTYNGVVQGALPLQARKWKLASIGNGNFGSGNVPTGAGADSVRLAFNLMGYHLRINSGSVTTSGNLTINANWQNHGLTPTYDNWTVQYSLRNGAGTVVWTGNSAFDPHLFSPDFGQVPKTDIFSSPALAAGTYGLYVTVKDPTDYMVPLQLQITGRTASGINIGSYFLTNVTLSSSTNQRPTVSAGANQTIIQPDDNADLTGSASDPDGTIASYAWSQLSGPSTAVLTPNNTANITVSDLTTIGTYVFVLTVTDNTGATTTDDVNITVAATPNIPPVANPGNPQTIQMPDLDAALSAAGSTDSDGTITGYMWFLFTGPATVVFSDNTDEETDVDFTVPGTYFIGLTVTDDDGLQDTRIMQITVLAEPVQHGAYKWQRKFVN